MSQVRCYLAVGRCCGRNEQAACCEWPFFDGDNKALSVVRRKKGNGTIAKNCSIFKNLRLFHLTKLTFSFLSNNFAQPKVENVATFKRPKASLHGTTVDFRKKYFIFF